MLDKYNTALSQLDSQLNAVENSEVGLDELSARMLAAVGVKYGKDGDEYRTGRRHAFERTQIAATQFDFRSHGRKGLILRPAAARRFLHSRRAANDFPRAKLQALNECRDAALPSPSKGRGSG